MIAFAKRTMKLYFRDKASVFFSLFAVLIIVGMYVLFLGDVWAQDSEFENPKVVMDTWIMSGLLAVVTLTTTMGAFGIMVEDRHKKISKDFYSSPIKRTGLAAGYISGAFMIGVIMSIITFIVAQIYLLTNGGYTPDIQMLLKILGIIVLSTFTNTAMVFLIVSFLKSQNAFGTASSIVGTLVGFLTGIYMPVGILPEAVQVIVKAFPPSHAATLFRQIMMEPVIKSAFEGAPEGAKEEFARNMGVSLTWGGNTIPSYISVAVLIVSAFVFFALAVLSISRKSR